MKDGSKQGVVGEDGITVVVVVVVYVWSSWSCAPL